MPLAAGLAQAGDRHFRLRQFLFPIFLTNLAKICTLSS
jgi:hypothetical protein